jgi:hypothetical protein
VDLGFLVTQDMGNVTTMECMKEPVV